MLGEVTKSCVGQWRHNGAHIGESIPHFVVFSLNKDDARIIVNAREHTDGLHVTHGCEIVLQPRRPLSLGMITPHTGVSHARYIHGKTGVVGWTFLSVFPPRSALGARSEDQVLSGDLGSPEQIERGTAIDAAGDIRQFNRNRLSGPWQQHGRREFDECGERLALYTIGIGKNSGGCCTQDHGIVNETGDKHMGLGR